MPRQPRLIDDGLIYHALNRGNNRAAVFVDDRDYFAFLQTLAQTRERYPFRLYAYCLMSNHFHLVLQPTGGQSISRIMQSLTVAHTWRVHKQQGSVGHVWQGRFKSPVIQDDNHLFVVMRYVESNPLRAGIVTDMADHRWSSYAFHALGLENDLVHEAPGWSTLANSEEARQTYWRQWVHTPLTERELVGLRQAVVSGRPYGSESWVERIASRLGIDLLSRPRGRPSRLQK